MYICTKLNKSQIFYYYMKNTIDPGHLEAMIRCHIMMVERENEFITLGLDNDNTDLIWGAASTYEIKYKTINVIPEFVLHRDKFGGKSMFYIEHSPSDYFKADFIKYFKTVNRNSRHYENNMLFMEMIYRNKNKANQLERNNKQKLKTWDTIEKLLINQPLKLALKIFNKDIIIKNQRT